MGSQTLEILRQGVWASLTGGWFYDSHQGVFCNVVHLYLWLFLLCSPFVAYLYFPSTWLTWCIYCILTSITILLVKLVNMALHRLYDRAQTMSEANLKNPFFKVTKETELREDETGIEMKVLGNDDSRNSLEQVLNDVRIEDEENSMMSMENSIIDLKVDVHRKNSSESIELMFYAPSLIFGNNSQQDQQSIAGSTSVSKSIRSTNNAAAAAFANSANSNAAGETVAKYLAVYPEHESEISNTNSNGLSAKNFTSSVARQTAAQAAAAAAVASASGAPHLLRKSSEESKRRHQRRRLERQSSLDATAESAILSKLMRNQSDTIGGCGSGSGAARNETFLHSQQQHFAFANAVNPTTTASTGTGTGTAATLFSKSASATKMNAMNSIAIATTSTTTTSSSSLYATTNNATQQLSNNGNSTASSCVVAGADAPAALSATSTTSICNAKNSRLQRHRSSETHDERLKQQQRGMFLPIHHEHHHPHHVASGASSSGALAAIGSSGSGGGSRILNADDMELGLGGSASGVDNRAARALQPWILGSSSDVYIEDDSFTKSDFGIEQIEYKSKTAFLIQQQYQLNSHHHPQQFRSPHNLHNHHHHHHHHGVANIRKDSNSTMSALQLPVTPPPLASSSTKSNGGGGSGSGIGGSGGGMKRRRHSNATSLFKSCAGGTAAAAAAALASGQQTTVRRIKSAALEISCPRPSVSNLSPHPNSVEAINGQQQIKNPQSALLPPPSKCLVRNPHLNLCPKFGGSFGGSTGSGGSGGSLNFGASASGSTTALIEPVYPIVEQADKKPSRNLMFISQRQGIDVFRRNRGDLEIADIDDDDEDDDIINGINDDGDNNVGVTGDDTNSDMRVPRRHNALCYKRRRNRNHRSTESDVGDILADDDLFKDFDNLEHILNDMQQTHKQLDDLKAAYAELNKKSDTAVYVEDLDEAAGGRRRSSTNDELEDGPSTSTQAVLRQRLHSTDSETDNNGSRSPLLSVKLWECSSGSGKAADKAMRAEIIAVQQKHKNVSNTFPQHLRGEGDSGCPSSDCEQISASSKDMLLSGMDAPTHDATATSSSAVFKCMQANNWRDADEDDSISKSKDVEEGIDSTRKQDQNISTATNSNQGKSLGAIPKVVKYREVDETSGNGGSQLHKRRGGSSTGRSIIAPNSQSKGASGTSSSTSSPGISAEFSAEIHKMIWLMNGGEVDDRGHRIGADGAPITEKSSNIKQTSISSAYFQYYQDAIQALHGYPDNINPEALSLSERIYFRDKLRRSSKQISEPGNSSIGDFSHATDLHPSTQQSTTISQGRTTAQPSIGVIVATSALNARNVSNAATLSIQGLINVINDERNSLSRTRSGNSGSGVGSTGGVGYISQQGGAGNAAAPAILNVDGQPQIDTICDYWRPAATCLLTSERPFVPKSFYKYRFKCFGYEHEFKISMDRLELLALFDRDLHWFHILLSVILCAAVAYLGATILQQGYYKDLFAFLFCAVIAGSQYSLVKSVQPDAASPIHGFNKTVAYSRAIYFSLCGGLLLLLEQMRRDYLQEPPKDLSFFGIHYSPAVLTAAVLHIMYVVLLCFPLIFSLGLFPQINTFLMYLLEQIDMHVFGGNAAGSLLGSFLCVLRSILGVMLLYGPLYAALAEGRGTQFIVFSIFCAMLIPLGYHLSRSASDFSHIWALIKNCIVSTYRDDDDELSAASSSASSDQKMATSTPKQLKPHSRRSSSAEKTIRTHARTHGNTVSHENIEMASLDKLPTAASTEAHHCEEHEHITNLECKSSKSKASSLCSSSQTLGKTLSSSKKAITASNSLASMMAAAGGAEGGSGGDGDGDVAIGNTENEFNLCRTNETSSTNGHNEIVITTDTSITNVNGAISETIEDNDNKEAVAAANDHGNNNAVAVDHAHDDKVSNSSTTNPGDMSTLTAGGGINCLSDNETESPDPLPKKLQNTVNTRLKNDIVVTALLAVIVLGLHCSTVFTVLQPDLNIVLYAFTITLGFLLHYIIPQMRKHMPWLCFSRPILLQKEFGQFEVSNAPKVMWFEKVYIYLCMVERNVLFPLLVISALTADSQMIANKFGIAWGTLIVSVCSLKFIRNSYSDPANQYLIVMFTVFFFRIDFTAASETFLIDYFFVSLAFRKCCDFLLKLQFIVTYIAPWQITWGSAFHAFAQPFSVPHSAMLFLQAAVSAILSTPLNPFLGSAIFLTSYVRPIKFWERDYNTRRIDHSNTRLSSQLERDLGADDNNLNSIFYEHLTRSLQHSLCGDLLMGRWGNVNQGDCFVLASDYLNCLVHIIELGNGLCTFQMRGLEFRGTYCQQREVEAITEDVDDNDGCCCCDPGHLPRLLSINAMFSTRWLAWQVVAAQYVLEGYSISDNLASASLQVFEYRKVLITYYIKSIIYYVIKNPKLEQWLASASIQGSLRHTLSRQFVDLDPIFNYNLDEDFDFRAVGITRSSFCYVYLSWINYCCDKRKESQNPPTSATPQTPAAAYNDSKSTPNLSTSTNAQTKSHSQQQLRTRPQKSATMSGSATVNSNEHIAISQSFANISRQTSESAPGLSGAGLSHVFTSTAAHGGAPLNDSFNNSAATVGASVTAKLPLGQLRPSRAPVKPLRKEGSPTATVGRAASEEASRERPAIRLKVPAIAKDSPIVSLCLALGLLARRSLASASSHNSLTGVEFFLHGLHALFKGDFRITSSRDEWVFADMELLHSVVAPAVKMALKLQQDHISNPDEFLDPSALYEAIDTCAKDLVISHEADPVWRSAVLRGAPNLLALRHVMEDGSDEYRIIRLTKRLLSFRVIKLNRECVRGLWAGQQQELIYLRNRNPERGSIQNAKQALRNIINSSCDQPIGYPIYVSPLTTSYADTNDQLREIIGGAITLESIKSNVLDSWHRIRERCRQGCSSGSAMETSNIGGMSTVGPGCSAGGDSGEIAPVYISAPLYNTLTVSNFFGLRSTNVSSIGGSLGAQYGSDGISTMRNSLAVMPVKPSSTTLLAGLLNREREQERERDMLRDARGIRKSQTQSSGGSRAERERRATLPIASTSLGVVSGGAPATKDVSELFLKMGEKESTETHSNSSPRYTKISCSSGSIGIGNIITTPGDYPRKSKGPICLTAAAAAMANESVIIDELIPVPQRQPRIELYKKVIIVDYTEIYDCLDLGRRIDVIWPSEEMRSNGGRLSWKNWVPLVGMVGYVVHYWIPNHADERFRSHVNNIIYLIEIGEHFVPVGEYGLREYNQIVDKLEEMEAANGTSLSSRRSSMQHELDELHHEQREGLTPILGSSLESPTSQLASTSGMGGFGGAADDDDALHTLMLNTSSVGGVGGSGGAKAKIKAVSSSSSEDEIGLLNLEKQRREILLNMWKLIADQKNSANDKQHNDNDADENADIDDDGDGDGNDGDGDNVDMVSHEHSAEGEEEIYDDAIEDNNIKITEVNDDDEMLVKDKRVADGDDIKIEAEVVKVEKVESIVTESVAHASVILTLTSTSLDNVNIGVDDNEVQTSAASVEPNAVIVNEDIDDIDENGDDDDDDDDDNDNDNNVAQTPILLSENNKENSITNDNNTKESDASEV